MVLRYVTLLIWSKQDLPRGNRFFYQPITAQETIYFLFLLKKGFFKKRNGFLFSCFRWLLQHARAGGYDDLKISNVTDSIACLGLAGPRSRDVMTKLTSIDMSHQAFKFLNIKELEVGGIPVKAIRISYTGSLGVCPL